MTNDMRTSMRQATRLTHAGNLHKATALIQRSLGAVTRTGHATPAQQAPHQSGSRAVPDPAVVSVKDGQAASRQPDAADFRATGEPPDTRIERATVSSHGIDLDYRLASPQDRARAAPLILMLHECTQDADDFAIGTDMDRLATTAGFHVLYPSQSSRRNRSSDRLSRRCRPDGSSGQRDAHRGVASGRG